MSAGSVFHLYWIVCALNGKRYVGQTNKRFPRGRWAQHISASKTQPEPLYRAMRKYGVANFKFEYLGAFGTQADVDEAEVLVIAQYRTRTTEHGYNVSPGGRSGGSGPLRPETRLKIGAAHRGRKLHPDHAAAIARAVRSPEARERRRQEHLGVRPSDETRAKLSAAGRGRRKTAAHAANVRKAVRQLQVKRSPKIRGRHRGSNHHRARVTEDQVRAMRQASAAGAPNDALCAEYGLKRSQISAIVNRKAWVHVP